VIASIIAIGGMLLWRSHSKNAAAPKAEVTPIVVDVVPAVQADVPGYLDGLGTVQAYYTVKVTARVDGRLDQIAFQEGQTVQQGALLAQIDPRPFQAALDQALAAKAKDDAQLANNERDLARYLELAPNDLASKQTVDTQHMYVAQAQAQVKADEAAIENARTQLSYTTITAPFTGRTGIRQVDPGNIVRAADTTGIVTLTQMQPISLVFTLPEDTLPQLAAALARGPVTVSARSRDATTTYDTGTVALIDNQIDQTTGTIKVKATFPNAHLTLWPGQFVTARVLLKVSKDALTIPAVALQRNQNGFYAYVLREDSTVEARSLKVLQEGDETIIIGSGLKPGERVVTTNFYRISPGAKVKVATTAPTRAAATSGADGSGNDSGSRDASTGGNNTAASNNNTAAEARCGAGQAGQRFRHVEHRRYRLALAERRQGDRRLRRRRSNPARHRHRRRRGRSGARLRRRRSRLQRQRPARIRRAHHRQTQREFSFRVRLQPQTSGRRRRQGARRPANRTDGLER
jgi:multidrug efflux system membrane fusion protein